MDPSLLAILAAVLGFVAIAGVGFAFAGTAQTRTLKRAQAIAERNRTERSSRGRSSGPDPAARRKQILQNLKDEERRQRKAALTLPAKIQQAGLGFSVKTFWIISGVLGVVVMAMTIVLGVNPLVCLVFAAAAAFGLPRWALNFLYKRRAKKFGNSFADAADIIVRGIKTGLPVHECLQIIGRESPEPLASEFRRLVESVQHGVTIEQALEKMYERMPLAELRFFTIVIGIQQKTGGNLAEALANLSGVLRARKLMREKIKAMSSEATASALIIGSLPPGVMILILVTTPSYLAILFHTTKGQLILGGAVIWMAIGIFVMKRMVSFKI